MRRSDLRVLQLLLGGTLGGAERLFEKHACALHERGLKQSIVIKREEKRAANLFRGGLEPLQPEQGTAWRDICARWQLQRHVSAYFPHIVTAWMNRAARRMNRDMPGIEEQTGSILI